MAVSVAVLVACGGEDSRFVEDEPETYTCERGLAADTLADRVLKTTLNDLESYSLSHSVDAQGTAEGANQGGVQYRPGIQNGVGEGESGDRGKRQYEN